MLLQLAVQCLPREQRPRYLREWTTEAVSQAAEVSPVRFSVRVLASAPLCGASLRDGASLSFYVWSVAVASASLGSWYFMVLCVMNGFEVLAVGFVAFAVALVMGGVGLARADEDLFLLPRTHLAGVILAFANLYLALQPAKFPVDPGTLANDDVPLIGVAVSTLTVVVGAARPLRRFGLTRIGMVALAANALVVAGFDVVNFFVVRDVWVRTGIALTGLGALAAAPLIMLGTQTNELFAADLD